MRTQNPIVDVVAKNFYRAPKPRAWVREFVALVIGATLILFAGSARSQQLAATAPAASMSQPDVQLVIGGETVKNHSVGTLSVVGNSLQFTAGKKNLEVEARSILDVSTNQDSRQDITGVAKFATMAIPYGGGRALSLFSHGVDVLTLEFKDTKGGFHGAVFVLPKGDALLFKSQLVGLGAKASVPVPVAAPANK